MDEVAKTGLVAFAKNPLTEKYKTRLWDDLQSSQLVATTYELLLKITNQALNEFQIKNSNAESYWAINSEAKDLPDYFSSNIKLTQQGFGSLGERLHLVYQELKKTNQQVIIVGSDLPFLSTELLNLTVKKLQTHDLVIGPSDDGGFYLFASKLDFDKNFWTSVEYSQTTTLEQLIGSLKDIRVASLPTLTDIDDLKSFIKANEILKISTHLSIYQNDLISFFDSNIKLFSESFSPNQKDLFYLRKNI